MLRNKRSKKKSVRDEKNMKRKITELRKETGITLIALVITILIIIILSVIAINMAFGDNGLIKRAEDARAYYSNDTAYTDESLANVDAYIADVLRKWHYDENGDVTNGRVTLAIGDYVNYDCTTTDAKYTSPEASNGYGDQTFTASEYQYGWRVLGADEETGELLIVSEDFVPLEDGYTNTTANRDFFYLRGQEGYQNGVDELEKICAIYGNGQGATGARSITVEDINKITGYNPNNVGVYDPEQTGSGTKYGAGALYEYGNRVTYYWDGTVLPYCRAENGLEDKLTTDHNNSLYGNSFYWYEEKSGWKSSPYTGDATTDTMQEITELQSNYYNYYPNTLTDDSSGETVGISTDSTAYKMLFTNSSTGANSSNTDLMSDFEYWIGSIYVYTGTDCAYFGSRYVRDGHIARNKFVILTWLPIW